MRETPITIAKAITWQHIMQAGAREVSAGFDWVTTDYQAVVPFITGFRTREMRDWILSAVGHDYDLLGLYQGHRLVGVVVGFANMEDALLFKLTFY